MSFVAPTLHIKGVSKCSTHTGEHGPVWINNLFAAYSTNTHHDKHLRISYFYIKRWNTVKLFLYKPSDLFISYLAELMKIRWKQLMNNVISCFHSFFQTISQNWCQ